MHTYVGTHRCTSTSFLPFNVFSFRRCDFSLGQTILRFITRLKGLPVKEVYQNVNILAGCVYEIITRDCTEYLWK